MDLSIFDTHESQVRSYVRAFPTVFSKAEGYRLEDEDGRSYVDFFAGAGTLNYGHNHPAMRDQLVNYLQSGGVVHSLDMATEAKRDFLKRFSQVILAPRNMDYKVMFTGPTGTNAVEAALKLARKATGRTGVISFTNAFHGMTLGALSVTGNRFKRAGAGVPLHHTTVLPYDPTANGGAKGADAGLKLLESTLRDGGSGVDLPAAVILETVQGEGGVNACSMDWLKGVEALCRRHGVLLIVDDIQAGCGRTGTFFSFEPAGISPDFITLSKSLSGFGLPFAVTLVKPEYDQFAPGEHNGTFRGHNLAFVTATEALSFWESDEFAAGVREKGQVVRHKLEELAEAFPALEASPRGRGLLQGLHCGVDGAAGQLSAQAFQRGLVAETSGSEDDVLKIMPPLVIDQAGLDEGFSILHDSAASVLSGGAVVAGGR